MKIFSILKALTKNTSETYNAISAAITKAIQFFYQTKNKTGIEVAFSNYSFVALQKRSKYVSQLDNYAVELSAKGEELPYDEMHPVNMLFRNPNPIFKLTLSSIKELLQFWKDYNGNAYLYTPLNEGKYPTIMYVLPSNEVNPKINNDNINQFIEYYEFRLNGKIIKIPPQEVCHIKSLCPSPDINTSLFIGTPKMMNACSDIIKADSSMVGHIVNYFERQAIPPMVIQETQPSQMTAEKQQLLVEGYRKGIPNSVPTALIPFGLDLKPLATGGDSLLNKLIDNSLTTDIRNRILHNFEVPEKLITSNYDNRNASLQVRAEFMDNVIEPEQNLIDEALTIHFRQWFPNILVKHTKYVYTDKEFELKEDLQRLQFGALTLNEYRKKYDMLPVDSEPTNKGDIPLRPSGLVSWFQENQPINFSVDNTQSQEQATPTKSVPNKAFDKFLDNLEYKEYIPEINFDLPINIKNYDFTTEILDDKFKDKYYNFYAKKADKYEVNLKKIMLPLLKSLQKECQNNIEKRKINKEFRNLVVRAEIINENLFDLKSWLKMFAEKTDPALMTIIENTIKAQCLQLNKKYSKPDFEKIVSSATKQSSAKISESINTIDKNLKSIIQNTIDDNVLATEEELRSAILKNVNNQFDNVFTKSRLDNIVRTTTTNAIGNAQTKTQEKFGYDSMWLSQRDEAVRQTHIDADGEIRKNGMFEIGDDTMPHPCGGSLPEENCNCRCYTIARKK